MDGYIEIRSLPEMKRQYNLADMEENADLLNMLGSPDIKVLVHISNGKYSAEARRFLASYEKAPNKVAMVAKSPFHTLVGNFFLGINKPKSNIKLFNSKEKALGWLIEG